LGRHTARELAASLARQLLVALLSQVQVDLEFAVDVAVLPRDVQVEEARAFVTVPADVGVRSPPSGKRGPMVLSGCDLSLYPSGV